MVWLFLLAFFAHSASSGLVPDLPKLRDDATCSVPESSWFKAENHRPQIAAQVESFQGVRDLHMLDAFGASQAMAKCWRAHGYSASSYDIKLNTDHDICTERGFHLLLQLGCRLMPHGICMAGPPCSLHVSASQSVHERSFERLLGNQRNWKVRLGNRIWINTVEFLRAILDRQVYIVLEQPSSSWAFRAHLEEVILLGQLVVVLTWMGFWGHDLAKPSHLLGNLRSLKHLRRTCSQEDRQRFSERLEKRNRRRDHPKVYHQKVQKRDGTVGWQGCKNLPESAAYTVHFCKALLVCWQAEFSGA